MIPPKCKPEIDSEIDGNAYVIIGKAVKELKRNGADAEYVAEYKKKATAGDYDDLLQVTMEYVDFV